MVKQGKPDYGDGGADRRLHIVALTTWQEQLSGRTFPKLSDFHPANLPLFADNGFVLDVTDGIEKPVITYAGAAVEKSCGGPLQGRFSTEMGSDTVFFHLADHFVEIIANRLPIGFEAEYDRAEDAGGGVCRYRGVLLPMSDGGKEVEYIVGVLNWIES